ncbi:MAG: class I SAM-dependent methyltransferase [Myxococcales bacterium]|nr:class I SAM-dependent methyltransferase [Myxococcales bacterium]
MDILTALDRQTDYSKTHLQLILGAWVVSSLREPKAKISTHDGDVEEGEYDKRSLYSLLYALYRSLGEVPSDGGGESYELTFNTWGYAWPKSWGPCPVRPTDPQRFGKHAYTGLYEFAAAREHIASKDGRVHIVEMGSGTGAGAHHVCGRVLPACTYHAVDMQQAAIATCRRKFVPELGGRLQATCADATHLPIADGVADFVAVNETHVTEHAGQVTDEDRRFFHTAKRLLKPGGHLVWGNAIPTATWDACLAYLPTIGLEVREVRDVTPESIQARDEDKARIDAYVEHVMSTFHGFRIPVLGTRRRRQAEVALKNFARNPGTRLYQYLCDGTDAYKVVLAQKTA